MELALDHVGQLGLHGRTEQGVEELHRVAVLEDARHLEPGGVLHGGRLLELRQLRGQVQRASVAMIAEPAPAR